MLHSIENTILRESQKQEEDKVLCRTGSGQSDDDDDHDDDDDNDDDDDQDDDDKVMDRSPPPHEGANGSNLGNKENDPRKVVYIFC